MICNSIDIIKKYIPTIINNDFEKYRSEVKEANKWFEKEITGKDLYQVIIEATEAEETPEDRIKIIELSEAVVARKAYIAGIPSYDLTETAGGFVVTRNENQAPASPERVKKLEDALAQRLTDAVEDLLEYLEETEELHDSWKGSPTYAVLTETYIHTLREFNRYSSFRGSRIDFIQAKQAMRNIIHLQIEPVISSELSDEIIEQIRDGDLSETNAKIIEDLRFAFANFVSGNQESASAYMMRIRRKLMANPASFPAFQGSELFANIQAMVANKYNPDRSIFRAGF